MHILVITDYLPYPLISGDRIRVYNLLRRVAMQHQISLAAPLLIPEEQESAAHLRSFCSKLEMANVPRRHPVAHLPGLFRFALQGKPLEFKFLYSKELFHKIRQLASEIEFDIVQIEHSRMAYYLEALPPLSRCKKVLMLHNIASDQYERISHITKEPVAKLRAWLLSRQMRRWEPGYAERFNCCVTVSEVDRNTLLTANPRLHIDVIPNGVDTTKYQPLSANETKTALLFIGTMNYEPCVDAAVFFCNQVLPLIRQEIGEVQMWIVGADPSPEVVRLAGGDGVHVTGRVEDVLPYYEEAGVCVVPLRAGGGTRLKILEAMALGRPVVSTSIGCEGLDVIDGQHLLIADTPKQFAEKTIRLLTDRIVYQRIIAEARELVVAKYDWDVIAGQLIKIYEELIVL